MNWVILLNLEMGKLLHGRLKKIGGDIKVRIYVFSGTVKEFLKELKELQKNS